MVFPDSFSRGPVISGTRNSVYANAPLVSLEAENIPVTRENMPPCFCTLRANRKSLILGDGTDLRVPK
jgi:hypothetical protein